MRPKLSSTTNLSDGEDEDAPKGSAPARDDPDYFVTDAAGGFWFPSGPTPVR